MKCDTMLPVSTRARTGMRSLTRVINMRTWALGQVLNAEARARLSDLAREERVEGEAVAAVLVVKARGSAAESEDEEDDRDEGDAFSDLVPEQLGARGRIPARVRAARASRSRRERADDPEPR